ncbi:MAG: methyltransferase domain-containing protein [Phycisphaerales bacterium]
MLTRRVVVPERLDDPLVAREELVESFRFIRVVNRRLGGVAAIEHELARLVPAWPTDRPLRVLDLGTGVADLPLAAIAWADRRGLSIECVGVEMHRGVLELAHEATAAEPRVSIVELDARRSVEHFGVDSFDLVHAGMFLHHLEDLEVMTMLATMSRVARVSILWNDLVRSRFNALAIRVLTIGRHPTVRFDAAASVSKGFTIREVRDLARRVGLPNPLVRRVFAGRFALVSTKPGFRLPPR